MKSSRIALAVGAAFATLAGGASATTVFPSHDLTVYVGSASALRDSIGRLLRVYCKNDGNRRFYRITSAHQTANFPGTSNNDYRAYECQFTVAGDAGHRAELDAKGLAGKKVLIYHTVTFSEKIGGSIVGIVPIVRNVTLNYPDANSATCALSTSVSGTVTTTATDGPTTFPIFQCGAHIAQRPEIGVTDTEPSSFRGPNVTKPADDPSGTGAWSTDIFPPLPTDDPIQSNPQTLFAVGFGIAVTKNILDPAQHAVAPADVSAQHASLTNLPHPVVQSILSGQITDLNQISPSLPSKPLQVCRRTQGSGTQASFNAMINFNPCLTAPGINGLLTIADAGFSTGVPGEYNVFENPASSGVRACMQDAHKNGRVGVGILTLEDNGTTFTTGTNANYQFIAIDGVAPFEPVLANDTVDGTADRIREDRINDGSYFYVQEPTIQWRVAGANALPAGLKTNFAEMIRDNAGDPVVTKQLPGVTSLPVWWSATGLARTVLSSGISNYSRLGNSCQPLTYQPF